MHFTLQCVYMVAKLIMLRNATIKNIFRDMGEILEVFCNMG